MLGAGINGAALKAGLCVMEQNTETHWVGLDQVENSSLLRIGEFYKVVACARPRAWVPATLLSSCTVVMTTCSASL